jgi:ADP-ribose pyrophosphatase
MNLKEIKKSRKVIHESGFVNIYQDTVELPNKNESERLIVLHPGASCVLAINDHDEVVLVRQYRYALEQEFLEVPAGKLDPNEDPLTCAKRELLEETGYHAKNITHLQTIHNAIGYSDEKIEIYLATELTKESQQLDEDEFLAVEHYSIEEIYQLIKTNQLTDAKTIIAIQAYLLQKKGA